LSTVYDTAKLLKSEKQYKATVDESVNTELCLIHERNEPLTLTAKNAKQPAVELTSLLSQSIKWESQRIDRLIGISRDKRCSLSFRTAAIDAVAFLILGGE
jgi:hypothetical protein